MIIDFSTIVNITCALLNECKNITLWMESIYMKPPKEFNSIDIESRDSKFKVIQEFVVSNTEMVTFYIWTLGDVLVVMASERV